MRLLPVAAVLALIVMSSGCINPIPGITPHHTENPGKPYIVEVSVLSKPLRPVMPGESFDVMLLAQNTDPDIDVNQFTCNINDPSLFTLVSPAYPPSTLYRTAKKTYKYTFKVPSEGVVNKLTLNIGYKCSYHFDAHSTLIYSLYSQQAYDDYITQGKSISAYTHKSGTDGPLQIDMSIGNDNSGDIVKQGRPAMFSLKMHNDGDKGFVGTVNGYRNYLPPGSVVVEFDERPLSGCSVQSLDNSFSCSTTNHGGASFCTCRNIKNIEFINGESTPIMFRVNFRNGVTDDVRQFSIVAKVSYDYIFEGSVPVEVNPE